MSPATPAIHNADPSAAMPSNGTAVAFKLTNGVPFEARLGVNGDSGIVGCNEPTDVSSGTNGTSEVVDDCTNGIDGPAGEPRTVD